MSFQLDIESQLKDPKQKKLLIAAGAIFAAAGVIFWLVFFRSPFFSGGETADALSPFIVAQPKRGGVRESELRQLQLDTEVVKSKIFSELKVYSKEIPVKVIEQGNARPFVESGSPRTATPASVETMPAPSPSGTPEFSP